MACTTSDKHRPSILLMGVSGVGKTTIGRKLANLSDRKFIDADDYHDHSAILKMTQGHALTDEDRAPWLARLNLLIHDRARPQPVVLACSALKQHYRTQICQGPSNIALVFLHAPKDELRRRLQSRQGHFMGDALLDSQLATLQPPQIAPPDLQSASALEYSERHDGALQSSPTSHFALKVDALQTPELICTQILSYIKNWQ